MSRPALCCDTPSAPVPLALHPCIWSSRAASHGSPAALHRLVSLLCCRLSGGMAANVSSAANVSRELVLRRDAPALRAGETSLKTNDKNEIVSSLSVRDCAFCWHIVTRSRVERPPLGTCSFRMRLLPVVRLSWLHISAATCPCCSAPSGRSRRAIRTPEGGSTGRVTQLAAHNSFPDTRCAAVTAALVT